MFRAIKTSQKVAKINFYITRNFIQDKQDLYKPIKYHCNLLYCYIDFRPQLNFLTLKQKVLFSTDYSNSPRKSAQAEEKKQYVDASSINQTKEIDQNTLKMTKISNNSNTQTLNFQKDQKGKKKQQEQEKESENRLKKRNSWLLPIVIGSLSTIITNFFLNVDVFYKIRNKINSYNYRQKVIKKYTNMKLENIEIFKDYDVYKRIQNQFIKYINHQSGKLQAVLITGPPGIGKTTCMTELIANIQNIELIKNKQKKNRIFYCLLGSGNYDDPKIQVNLDAVLDLRSALGNLLIEQSHDQTFNNILIIDEINVICRQQYRQLMYHIRGLIDSRVKIIALSSCSKASSFIDSVISGYLDFENLNNLNENEIKKILKFKLSSTYKIKENVLESIAYKFTTIRYLDRKIRNFQPSDPSNQSKINEEANIHFNPILSRVIQIKEKIEIAARNLQKSQDNEIIYLINSIVNIIARQLQLTGVKFRKQKKYLTKSQRKEDHLDTDFKKQLYELNVVFGQQSLSKDQHKRLSMILWTDQALNKILKQEKLSKEAKEMAYQVKDKWEELVPYIEKFKPYNLK